MPERHKRRRSKKVHRSKKMMSYHSRKGHPLIHTTETGRQFIMVRAPKGKGTKRLYLVHGNVPESQREKS